MPSSVCVNCAFKHQLTLNSSRLAGRVLGLASADRGWLWRLDPVWLEGVVGVGTARDGEGPGLAGGGGAGGGCCCCSVRGLERGNSCSEKRLPPTSSCEVT